MNNSPMFEDDPVWVAEDFDIGLDLHGAKWEMVSGARFRLCAPGQIGIAVTGSESYRSVSRNRIEDSQILIRPEAEESVGIVIGRGGDDHCLTKLLNVEINVEHGLDYRTAEGLAAARAIGATGVILDGGNTVDMGLEMVTGAGLRTLIEALGGGAVTTFDQCGGTGCAIGLHLDSGREFVVNSGSWEHCGAAIVSGMPGGGAGLAPLAVTGLVCRSPAEGVSLILGRGGNVSLRACKLEGTVILNHNGSGRQVIIEEACYPKPVYRVVRGDWRVRRDGVLIVPPTR